MADVIIISETGPQGAPGLGAITGGTTGQVLVKASGTDYDYTWSSDLGDIEVDSLTIGGDAVTSAAVGDAAGLTYGTIASARLPAFTGDVTSPAGSSTLTLSASGVSAGTYKSVTVDTKGRVTAGTNPTTLVGYGITDAAKSDLSNAEAQATLDAREQASFETFGWKLTKAVRSSFSSVVLPNNALYFATDTGSFYRGDGSTAGGVASVLGLTHNQLIQLGIIQPRHRRVLPALRAVVANSSTTYKPAGNAFGDSHTQNGTMLSVLGAKLAELTGVGTGSNYAPYNAGVGGSCMENIAVYVAQNADDTTVFRARKRSVIHTNPFDYCTITTPRNDSTQTTVAQYSASLGSVLTTLWSSKRDAVIIVDPPAINYATGAIIDTANGYGAFLSVLRRSAAAFGATLVDHEALMRFYANSGINLATFYISDGVHHNTLGYTIAGNLVYEAISANETQPFTPQLDGTITDLCTSLTSNFVAISTTGTLSTVTIDTTANARQVQTGSGSKQAYVLAAGQNVIFDAPFGAKNVIVQILSSSANTGTWGASLNTVSLGSGFSANDASGANREITKKLALTGSTSTNIQKDRIVITASGGQVMILGVVWEGPQPIAQHNGAFPGATEVGTWSNSTQSSTIYALTSATFRESSTVGDTATIKWYGTSLTCYGKRGTDKGKFTAVTDGAATQTVDLYSALNDYLAVTILAGASIDHTLGWHTSVLTVATKNASSSGQATAFGLFSPMVGGPLPSVLYTEAASGATLYFPETYSRVSVESVISGTPVIDWTPNSSSLTVTGGAARIRLER